MRAALQLWSRCRPIRRTAVVKRCRSRNTKRPRPTQSDLLAGGGLRLWAAQPGPHCSCPEPWPHRGPEAFVPVGLPRASDSDVPPRAAEALAAPQGPVLLPRERGDDFHLHGFHCFRLPRPCPALRRGQEHFQHRERGRYHISQGDRATRHLFHRTTRHRQSLPNICGQNGLQFFPRSSPEQGDETCYQCRRQAPQIRSECKKVVHKRQ